MIGLLVWACLAAGGPDDCRVVQIAGGFSADKQCEAYAPLMVVGWLKIHPELKLRAGTRFLCVPNPQWYLFRFGA